MKRLAILATLWLLGLNGLPVLAQTAASSGTAPESAPGAAASPAPMTVLDYYLLLPRERYFARTTEPSLRRLVAPEAGGVTDLANGYLQTLSYRDQPRVLIRLFPRPEGPPLVAVNGNENGTVGLWTAFVHFYRYQDGGLADVTAETLPRNLERGWGATLPREGATIEVYEKESRRYAMTTRGCLVTRIPARPLWDWTWDGNRFREQKAKQRPKPKQPQKAGATQRSKQATPPASPARRRPLPRKRAS